MAGPIITLTTDFGTSGSYVGQMRGVLLSLAPDAQLVDITHQIEPQNIRQAALVLADAAVRFPPGTVHLVVVDPGVGTDRRVIYAEIAGQQFVAPDNGVLSCLAGERGPSTIVELNRPEFWLPNPSHTFHGRDIMAPIAARVATGADPRSFGAVCDQLVMLSWPEARILANKIEGEIIEVDSFGNLITNITPDALADAPTGDSVTIRCDDHETMGIYQAYADQPPMTLIALFGSSGKLELAIVDDSAKIMLGVGVGAQVTVTW